MDQQVSLSNCIFLIVTQSYHSNVNPIGALHGKKITEAFLMHVFRIAFPASLLHVLVLGFWEVLAFDKSLTSTQFQLTHDRLKDSHMHTRGLLQLLRQVCGWLFGRGEASGRTHWPDSWVPSRTKAKEVLLVDISLTGSLILQNLLTEWVSAHLYL